MRDTFPPPIDQWLSWESCSNMGLFCALSCRILFNYLAASGGYKLQSYSPAEKLLERFLHTAVNAFFQVFKVSEEMLMIYPDSVRCLVHAGHNTAWICWNNCSQLFSFEQLSAASHWQYCYCLHRSLPKRFHWLRGWYLCLPLYLQNKPISRLSKKLY